MQPLSQFFPSISRSRFLAFASALLLVVASHAGWAEEISAVPTQFTAAARIKVAAEDLISGNYRLRLEQVRPGTADFDLLNFSNTVATRSLSVTIPNAPTGSYQLVLYRNQLGLTRVADAAVAVLPSIGVTLAPTTAAQGKSLRISVPNLTAGSVRVLYGGVTALGPLPVGDGAWTGKIVIPRDRPTSVPANVTVAVENTVGRVVVGRAEAVFRALPASTLPRFGLNVTQSPVSQVNRLTRFTVRGRLQDDEGFAPVGQQSLYFKSNNGNLVVPVDSTVQMAGDGTFTQIANSPDAVFDGLRNLNDTPGKLIFRAQGKDPVTESPYSWAGDSNNEPTFTIDGADGGLVPLKVRVYGRRPAGASPVLLTGAIVEADQPFQDAFTFDQGSQAGSVVVTEQQAYGGFINTQVSALTVGQSSAFNYGCENTLFRKATNAQGEANFTFDPLVVQTANIAGVYAQCDACRGIENTNPVSGGRSINGSPTSVIGPVTLGVNVFALHLGYRPGGAGVLYDPDRNTLLDPDTMEPIDRVDVFLDLGEAGDFDLRNVRIAGLGGPKTRSTCGGGTLCEYYTPNAFGDMYTYPNQTKWPDRLFSLPNPVPPNPGQIIPSFNTGRSVTLEINPSLYGNMTSGRIRIGNTAWANFVPDTVTPACLLDVPPGTEHVVYRAQLPNLTRLPASGVTLNASTGVASEGIDGRIELRFNNTQLRSFPIKVGTQTPPTGIDDTNPNIDTLSINGREDIVEGTHVVPSPSIPISSPGYGMGDLDNHSMNDSSFKFQRTADGVAAAAIKATSNNDVAGVPGGPRLAPGVRFGYNNNNQPLPQVLFDTGRIPLFRYSFGVPPIAEATMGADFWLRSELAFYGELKTTGMNATIDPTVEGGVNLFFDLDVLLGLASASVSAEATIGVTMRSVVGSSGLPGTGQQSGECFRFGLDALWEACAVGICAGDRINLIRIPDPPTPQCSASIDGQGFFTKMGEPNPREFDLARPRLTATALANDGRGNSVTVGIASNGALVASHLSGSKVVDNRTLAARPVAVQHIDVAFYAANKAMAVWSENTRTLAQVQDLMNTQGGRAFDDIVRTQRLRFSLWDGRAWTVPADLTSSGSDGKPQLAACTNPPRNLLTPCPRDGEITAVWERDANRNLDAPDIEVWSNKWTPATGWSREARVSNTGVSSDMLPFVAYRDATPVVVWAHNPSGHFVNLRSRNAAYRFLDGTSPPVIANALGTGVGWVSIGVSDTKQVVIAFTRAQDFQGFVGNRQALTVARSTICTAGVCTFQVTEPRDASGRQFRVERPMVAFDDDNTPIIGFRALAYGQNSQGQVGLPGDPPGILLGTGELATLRVGAFDLPTYTASLNPLSANGLQHWKPEIVYDASIGGMVAVSGQAVNPSIQSNPIKFAQKFSPSGMVSMSEAKALSDGSTLRVAGGGPNFVLREAALSRAVVETGQTLRLTADLVNIGQNYDPAVNGALKVVTTFNAPAGNGTPASTFNLTTPVPSNASRSLSLALTVPPGVRSDELQTVFIDIVADDDANDIGGAADQVRIELNAMPVPQNVRVHTTDDTPFVTLQWTSPTDSRIYGWRVWKRDAGVWKPLGSTRVKGYLDPIGRLGREEIYRVASYSRNGMESEPSLDAWGKIVFTDVLFRNGFEAR